MSCVMQWLFLSVVIAGSTASVLKHGIPKDNEDARYLYLPGDDGITRLIDTKAPIDVAYIKNYIRNPNNNGYWLFTRANPITHEVLTFGNSGSITNSNYDSSKTTVILVHGWNGHGRNKMNKLLTEAFLANSDVNLIVFDWSELAKRNYITAKGGTAEVGRSLSQFVNWLVETGLSAYDRIHLVGFSLGGHLVGNAGRETASKIARITALDPAAPLWGRDSDRLKFNDARYVEVIHTNIWRFGVTDPCGVADFYPNGGASMPGCILNKCSHVRAYEYLASSLKHNHLLANECETFQDAQRNRCNGTLNPMGNNDLKKLRPGIFRVNTGRKYPY